jgi:hypothetical protein
VRVQRDAARTGTAKEGGMRKRFLPHSILVLLALATIASIVRAQPEVPDLCPALALAPAAAAMGPPPVVHAGSRLLYFGATASVPGERYELVPDPNGRWLDEATGQRYGEHEMPGAAAAGFTLVRVGYVDGQVAQLNQQLYLWDPGTGIATYASALGLVSHAGCASDYWVHPDALRALPETLGGDVQVVRMPYAIGSRTFDAIRLQTTTAKGHTVYVYDLATGLMIFHGARTVGGPVEVRPMEERRTFGEGSTQLVSLWIADARDVAIPWAGYAPPAWTASVQRLAFQGTATTYTTTTAPVQLAIAHEVTIDRRGGGWLHGWTHTTQATLPGLPPTEAWSVDASGTASVGGWWIAPQALAALRAGQIIDAVTELRTTTSVTAADGARVTLSEVGPAHRIDATYDVATGALAHVTIVQSGALAQTVVDLALVRGP